MARAKGVKFGRPSILSEKEQAEIRQQHADGKSVSKLALDFDVSRPANYRALGKVGSVLVSELPDEVDEPLGKLPLSPKGEGFDDEGSSSPSDMLPILDAVPDGDSLPGDELKK